MKTPKKKAVVGMSGGVDSSVAAALLLRDGYEVIGVFMKNWSDGGAAAAKHKDQTTAVCNWRQEREDAQAVATKLGISLITVDFEEEYRRDVYAYMLAEYKAGRTPNPDVICNEKVKFGPFLERALALGADVVATGHYARVRRIKKQGREEVQLLAGVDPNKDQSYFLHRLSQEQLRQVEFPVGELTKPQVRALAREFDLPVAEKKDSVGICFIGEMNMPQFLAAEIPHRPGPVITTDGQVVGRHRGLTAITIGQRHGLGLGDGRPYFVVAKDMKRNALIVAVGDDPEELYTEQLTARDVHWIASESPSLPLQCTARIRYRQPLQECQVQDDNGGTLNVTFSNSQRAITPGQFVVFYDGEVCLGGGVID